MSDLSLNYSIITEELCCPGMDPNAEEETASTQCTVLWEKERERERERVEMERQREGGDGMCEREESEERGTMCV